MGKKKRRVERSGRKKWQGKTINKIFKLLQITMISNCTEFLDVKLRTNEKKILNTLNKDKDKITIRYKKIYTLKKESIFLAIDKMNSRKYVSFHA